MSTGGSQFYLPGQPIENVFVKVTDPLGNGLYKRNGVVRSALVGCLDLSVSAMLVY